MMMMKLSHRLQQLRGVKTKWCSSASLWCSRWPMCSSGSISLSLKSRATHTFSRSYKVVSSRNNLSQLRHLFLEWCLRIPPLCRIRLRCLPSHSRCHLQDLATWMLLPQVPALIPWWWPHRLQRWTLVARFLVSAGSCLNSSHPKA